MVWVGSSPADCNRRRCGEGQRSLKEYHHDSDDDDDDDDNDDDDDDDADDDINQVCSTKRKVPRNIPYR